MELAIMITHRNILVSLCCAVTAGWIAGATAETYPSRPITLVVPYAAGGPADVIARIVAGRMRDSLGQTIVIENVTGAGGSTGTGRVARAVPDGYTIMIGNWSTHVANGVLYTLPYDLMNDFEPISLIATEQNLIVAKKAVPADNLQQFIAWLKANANTATGGTSGVGGPSHVAAILFQKAIGTQFQLVPYRGAGPALQELMAGRIDMMIVGPSIVLPHLNDGTIKAYAVAAKSRLAAAPDIPTSDEAGLPDFHIAVWQGLWAPKGTPKDVIAVLNSAVGEALSAPTVRQRLTELAQEVPPPERQGPQVLRAYQKAEIAKWWPIIEAARIKGE
jgi:tripartite-type tricarboxylate transporter receptor subunit TctC